MSSLKGYDFSSHIHLFRHKELTLLLDVNSGAVHVLDDPAFIFVQELVRADGDWDLAEQRAAASFSSAVVKETRAEFERAYGEGSLFTSGDDLDSFDYGQAFPKSVCLNVAHACNMRCKYCFAQQGSFGQGQGLMPADIAASAVDFLIEASGPCQKLELDFFGGEPLLNMDVVKSTVDYARAKAKEAGKEISFTLTTNALKLDQEVRYYLVTQGIAVILSLDGRPEINDGMRVLPDGKGSYNRIAHHIKDMVAMRPVSYYVRGTFTAQNLDFVQDFKHLADMGFENISLEPVTGGEPGIALMEEHLPQISRQYEDLADFLLEREREGRPVNFFHFNLDLNRGPCLAKRMTGCGAGVEYLAVTPEGEIYPCHQFIGVPDFKLGDVRTGLLDPAIRRRFAANTLAHKECRRCWARFYCGGGCHALAYHENGDISVPSRLACQMHQKRLECSFYIAARRLGA